MFIPTTLTGIVEVIKKLGLQSLFEIFDVDEEQLCLVRTKQAPWLAIAFKYGCCVFGCQCFEEKNISPWQQIIQVVQELRSKGCGSWMACSIAISDKSVRNKMVDICHQNNIHVVCIGVQKTRRLNDIMLISEEQLHRFFTKDFPSSDSV